MSIDTLSQHLYSQVAAKFLAVLEAVSDCLCRAVDSNRNAVNSYILDSLCQNLAGESDEAQFQATSHRLFRFKVDGHPNRSRVKWKKAVEPDGGLQANDAIGYALYMRALSGAQGPRKNPCVRKALARSSKRVHAGGPCLVLPDVCQTDTDLSRALQSFSRQSRRFLQRHIELLDRGHRCAATLLSSSTFKKGDWFSETPAPFLARRQTPHRRCYSQNPPAPPCFCRSAVSLGVHAATRTSAAGTKIFQSSRRPASASDSVIEDGTAARTEPDEEAADVTPEAAAAPVAEAEAKGVES
jgi:hypothetical protein